MDFKELGLRAELVHAVETLGFQSPMPIQEKAIPTLLAGESDFVGLAQTGTGKTGAFGLPLIQQVDPGLSHPQGIVICPTRELCLQITNDLTAFAANLRQIRIAPVYGGACISTQIRQIRRGAQIIVATPGRLIDLINRKAVSLSRISVAVLDEADEMLNMGFQEDINAILNKMPEERRVWLFSATMPEGVAAISRNYLTNPVKVTVGGRNRGAKNIAHTCYVIHEKNRYQGLKRIIDFTPDIFGLVFCRTRKETQTVAESLMQDGYQAEALHGDLSQSQRDYVMRKFRQKTIRILVATDVAARGLDVEDISHVIHHRLPDEPEVYTHRSGRTARAGKSGESVALVNAKEVYRVRRLEKQGDIRFTFGKIPAGRDICKKRLFSMVEKIVQTDDHPAEIEEYLPAVYAALEGLDKEALIRRIVSEEFTRLLEYYRHAEDINVRTRSEKRPASKDYKRADRRTDKRPDRKKSRINGKKSQRFFINVGRLDKINEGTIVRWLCDKSGIRSGMIGEIALKREFSFFEVDGSAAGRVLSAVKNAKIDGRQVQVREVGAKKNNSFGGDTPRKKRAGSSYSARPSA
ncbi:DEAD/DEAH box helicase [Desulfonema ishimotonii]|uniref:DEAD/DEAH box helicase n=1 Tax=Desulfonema ishimotonii TaxID=45657 RepID=A0A401G447_9BACT|nr:DEAD/DEAH box helicase [Desulfonema ishimotonii]GBC63996.1 DEAD/DEAH box helicase [Desulfonema ishimotonii]